MKRFLLLTFSLCAVLTVSAQSAYEKMAASLTAESLPLVNITVDTSTVSPSYYVPAQIEIADPLCRTKGLAHFSASCVVRYRGTSSLAYPKKSFAVKLVDEAGEDLDVKVLDIRKENSWILDAMAIDRLRMRNKICFDVWNSFSHTPYETKYDNRNGIEAHHVEVFLNGDYHGLYCLSDKVDRKLLGLKKPDVDESGDQPVVSVRGVLYKCVNWGFGSTLMYRHQAIVPDFSRATWEAYELKLPEEYPGEDAWMPLYELIGFYQNAFTRSEFLARFDKAFYRQNVMDYLALCSFMYLRDNMLKNTYLSVVDQSVERRFVITPWDMDTSLGGDWGGGYSTDVVSDLHYLMGLCAPYEALRFDASFVSERDAYFAQLASTTFSLDSIADRMVEAATPVIRSGAWAREVAKWGGVVVPLEANLMDEVRHVLDWYRQNLIALGYSPSDVSVQDVDCAVRRVRRLSDDGLMRGRLFNLMGQREARPVRGRLYVSPSGLVIGK